MDISQAIKNMVDQIDLSQDECFDAISQIMSGEASDAHIAAFLIALRMKGETVDEITGGAKALAEKANLITPNTALCVDPVGTGGDKTNTFNISSVAALIAAAAGAYVAKHGNRSVSSRCGSADFYEALGICIELGPKAVTRSIEQVGFGFMFAPVFHPAMRFAGPVRRALGVRTIFNILGPLSNPARAKAQVLGVYDRDMMPFIAKSLQNLGHQHSMVVHGSDGSDELTLTGPSYVYEVFPDRIDSYTLAPEDLGFKRVELCDLQGGTPEENVQIALDLFSGKKGPCRDIAALNAGATLYVAGKSASLEEGIALAISVLDSGRVMEKLEQIRTFSVGATSDTKGA